MNRETPGLIAADINHSHSTLNRLLEEIEAHAMALATEIEDRVSILDELQQYTTQFVDEITSHMVEEERDVFGWIASHLPDRVDRLLVEHRELEVLVGDLIVAVELGRKETFVNDVVVKGINDQVRLLKYAYLAHSNHERLLLERVSITER